MESQSPPSKSWPPPPLTASSQSLNHMSPPPQFPPPPPPPPPPEVMNLVPLKFILALVAIFTIPALIYTFFFSIKYPWNPFRRRNSGDVDEEDNPGGVIVLDVVLVVKYQKDIHVKEIGSECPVCLSVFADDEDIKQLRICKHSFHASCIDTWLNSHNNCPICRASVHVKNSSRNTGRDNSDDLHQGLPDSANLV